MSFSASDQEPTFGQVIKTHRIARDWTMRTFARMVGISHSYLCNLETGKESPPSDAVLLKMAEHLDIPAHTLFALAGRLPPEVQHALWSNQAAPAFLATLGGLTLPDAQLFCQQVGKLLPVA